MIADMTQNELREAIVQRIVWGCRFDNSRSSAAGQVAMWLKRVEVGSFVVMRHEYGKCRYTPDWLRERNEESGDMEYIGPVYIIGVVTRKIKPYSAEEDYVVSQMAGPIPNICLVDWRRMGTKADLKEETQKFAMISRKSTRMVPPRTVYGKISGITALHLKLLFEAWGV
jgi:hypothetical protein